MDTVRLNVQAKINLTLDVTGTKDGYHTIDSLVCTVDLADRIVAKKRRDGLVSVTMHGMGSENIPPEENNAVRAGEAFVSAFGTAGADITVYKNIPIGAGLGGSSADAAGVLRAMAKLYGVEDRAAVGSLADTLGSDTRYLLQGGFARLRGRGEEVEPLGEAPPLSLLLLVPRQRVSTAECYERSDSFPRPQPHTDRALEWIRAGDLKWAATLFSNDLFPAADGLVPEVGEALRELRSFSPWGASMTGSGSAVFAVFETRELCLWAESRYRGSSRTYVLKTSEPKAFRSLYSVE